MRTFVPGLASGLVFVTLAGLGSAQEQSVDTDPYDVVELWLQPFARAGFAWGSHPGLFAESPDRIFIIQRGEIALPDPVPAQFDGSVGSIGMMALRETPVFRNCIFIVDGEGELAESWTQWDHLFENTNGPHKIKISPYDSERRVWVINERRNQIHVFSNDGKELLLELGEAYVAGEDKKHFGLPQDVAFSPDGSVYVADGISNSRVVKLDSEGEFVTAWGTRGNGPGQFNGVHGVATDRDGRVYVADRNNDRIQVFNADGAHLDTWGGLNFPNHIIVTADQDVWVADNQPSRMVKFDTEGTRLHSWPVSGRGPGQFSELHEFAIDSDGNWYGADNLHGRTQKFVPKPGADPSHLMGTPTPLATGQDGRRRPPSPVQFQAHDIARIRGGYAVAVADFNNDGRIDVIANSLSVAEVAWHENPTWERHVIVPRMRGIVNQAMADLDGDGIPEVAFQSAFAMQAANSEGLTWIAKHQGDPRQEWKAEQIDKFATSHHVVWADLDGNGELELVNAPLIGPDSLAPTYDQDVASVFWYGQDGWQRHTIADDIPGLIHRVRRVQWGPDSRDQILVASFEGITLYGATGTGDAMKFHKEVLSPGHVEAAPRLGASDVGAGMSNGKRFLASVEPWHGNEVVVYTESGGSWHRRVIFDKISSGHEVAVLDLNGDGRADVVANDNSRTTPGVHVFFSPEDPATGEWTYSRIESEVAMNSCVGADINRDGRPDLVCTGRGGVIRWYENLGPSRR